MRTELFELVGRETQKWTATFQRAKFEDDYDGNTHICKPCFQDLYTLDGQYYTQHAWITPTEKKIIEIIPKETFPFGFNYPRFGEISDSTLKDFGDWIYNHRHDFENASRLIYMMLYSCFDEHERDVVWGAFEKNVNTDFSEVITYLLKALNENLVECPSICQDIVYNFIKEESKSSDSLNYKYCVQMDLCENVKRIAEEIVNGERKAPDHIIQQCEELLKYTDDFGICGRYIGYLMGRSELFLDVLTTIRENY